jgi:hypothetical protein
VVALVAVVRSGKTGIVVAPKKFSFAKPAVGSAQ